MALATQAWGVDWNGPVTININPTVGAGLVEGKAFGAFNLDDLNIGDGPNRDGLGAGISLGVFMGQETANFAEGTTADFDNFWDNDRTWIYTGEINSGPNGLLSFAESIDDSTRIVIDGAVVLQDQVWNVPTTTGVLQFTPNTYHTIEIRMGNGTGGAGPVSVNNFLANVPTDPPTANGYGFGFSHTGATGTDGANYIKPIDPGDGSLFRHETAPAAEAGQDINVLGDTTVSLNKVTSDHITENSITFAPAAAAVTLTVNGSPTPGGTLRSLATVLATANSKTVTISGDADFAPGALSTGPNPGEATLTGVILQKNGGSGKLILDNPTNFLAGTSLRVIDGTLSLVGSGGNLSPVSSLALPIMVGGGTTGLAPVLRIGGGLTGTNFVNRILFTQNATLEHVSPGTDSITTPTTGTGVGFGIAAGRTLTVNVAGGGLVINSVISNTNSATLAGGTLVKKGLNTTLRLNGQNNLLTTINADEGRLEIANRISGGGTTAITPIIGANGTLALLNTSPTNFNRLPATMTVSTGTLEGVPGAFTTGASTASPSTLNLAGGALTLGPGFTVSPPSGLIANLYNGDSGAQAAFNTYENYLSYFVSKGSGTVTTTAANGWADLSFGLPVGGDPQMFAPIAPTFTATNNIVSRMHGKINVSTAGLYTFGAGSDDGSIIYIDGKLVVTNNFYQAHTRRTGSVELTEGLHDIDIGFYEGGGLNSLVVDWEGPATAGIETIPNSILVPSLADFVLSNIYNNPVQVTQNSTINSAAASVPSVSLSQGRTLTVNGNLFSTGALTLNGGAGTYTLNTATPFGATLVPSIIDANAAVALVKTGPGTLILEAGASPQLQNAASTVTATAGGLAVVLGPVNPTGNAAVSVNGLSFIVSSKGGNQSYALPTMTNGGTITAQRIGSGVAGTTATPIRVTLTGNLALNPATTMNLETADNYILAMAGISGNATVNVRGALETSGPINLGGPLNVVRSNLTAAQNVSAAPITITESTVAGAASIASTGPMIVTGSTVTAGASITSTGPITMTDSTVTAASSIAATGAVTVNGSTVTAGAGISGTSLAITGGTVTNTGPITAGTGITITGSATVSSILELRGGPITSGPIVAEGAIIHATSGVTNVATSATFTGLNPSGLFGRFVVRPGAVPGQFWPAQTEAGILAIETDNGPLTQENPLNGPLSFLPYQAADAAISAFFPGAPTEPNQYAFGFFGNFTPPESGLYSMQVAQVDDDAGWWVDLDFDGVFEIGGANGNELISQRNCCGDGNVGTVDLLAGRAYKVAIANEDGQGGNSLVGMIGLPAQALIVIDPSDPLQDGWWSYGLPNQVSVDAGAELNMEAINGDVNVLVSGELGLTESSSMDSLVISASGVVTFGGAGPALAEEPAASGELAGEAVVAVPEPATTALLLFGALSLFRRRRNALS